MREVPAYSGAMRPLIIGHRGAPGYRPEHTESAYRLAIAQGVDAVEPDIVLSRDGVPVIRHENEIGSTTDVADHPEFADRRTTRVVDGVERTGWFTEDFHWDELATLRCRERLADLRPDSAAFDGAEPILRLREVLAVADDADRPISVVVEVKHAQYFADRGFAIDELLLAEISRAGWGDRRDRLIFECFELGVLDRLRGFGAPVVFLTETRGAPADEVATMGDRARPFSWFRGDAGLEALVGRVDGISVAKRDLFVLDSDGAASGTNDLVARAHARGLVAYAWTLRPENRFLNQRYRSGDDPAAQGEWAAEFAAILDTGIDGVFVDHPDRYIGELRDPS